MKSKCDAVLTAGTDLASRDDDGSESKHRPGQQEGLIWENVGGSTWDSLKASSNAKRDICRLHDASPQPLPQSSHALLIRSQPHLSSLVL